MTHNVWQSCVFPHRNSPAKSTGVGTEQHSCMLNDINFTKPCCLQRTIYLCDGSCLQTTCEIKDKESSSCQPLYFTSMKTQPAVLTFQYGVQLLTTGGDLDDITTLLCYYCCGCEPHWCQLPRCTHNQVNGPAKPRNCILSLHSHLIITAPSNWSFTTLASLIPLIAHSSLLVA